MRGTTSQRYARWRYWMAVTTLCVTAPALRAQPVMSAGAARREPVVSLTATQRVTSAVDERHAQHVSPLVSQWQVRVDSIAGGALFARMPGDGGLRYRADGVLRLPVAQERAGVPLLTATPSRLRSGPMIDRGDAMLALADADRAAQHEAMLATITFAAAFDGLPTGSGEIAVVDSATRLSLRVTARRGFRVLSDSVVNGRAVRVVRDSTTIVYAHRGLLPSRFTPVVATFASVMHGTIVGVRVVDLGTRRTIMMRDTVRLRGRRQVDDGYGGSADLPAFEYSTREVTVRDSVSPPQVREPFDMVRTGSVPTPLRAQARDSALDSALLRLRVEPSITVRDSIRQPVRFTTDSAVQARMVAVSLAIGDTAAAVQVLTSNLYRAPRGAITAEHYRWLRGLLRSPTAALRVGVDRELLAVTLFDGLLNAPPVLLSAANDFAICTPAACRAMARDATAPSASLALRAVALVAAMVTTPRGWTDSVIANARTNPLLAGRALWFARGASSYAVASAKAPIPTPDASQSAWRFWLIGEDSAYLRARAATPMASAGQPAAGVRPRPITVSELAAKAIRFAEQRTGLSYASAFRARRALASDDSTRALFALLLMSIGDSVFSASALKTLVLGPPSEERRIAIQQITGRQRGEAPIGGLAPDSIAARIGMRVVESLFGGQPLAFVADANTSRGFFAAPPEVDSIPRFLSMDSLPVAVRERATALGHSPMPVGWSFVSGTTGSTTHVGTVRQSGPFFRIAVTFTTLFARSGARSGGYANGYDLWFVESPQGWVVFAASSWVT